MEIRTRRSGEGGAAVLALLGAARRHDGRDPLSDHKHLAFGRGEGATLLAERGGELIGLAQIVPAGAGSAVEMVVHPQHRSADVAAALLEASLAAAAPGEARVWAFDKTQVEALAARGARLDRQIAQLRRPLPPDHRAALPDGVTVRSFVAERDEAAWLEVNNEAFAGHPENGSWTRAVLAERMAQPWFDAAGLLMAWDRGGLAGFCWTKLHEDGVGEIYVIAVAARVAGQGVGRQLALAGLWDLTERQGATTAMLYAEVDNLPGKAMYRWLGFEVTRVDSCYRVG